MAIERLSNGRFVPGQSANPKGRPKKGQTMTDILVKYLNKKTVKIDGKLVSGKEAAAIKMIQQALKGDSVLLKYIYDRIDGKPDTTIRFDPKEMPVIEVGLDLGDEYAMEREHREATEEPEGTE